MANSTYDSGPQLPNYMKKRAEQAAAPKASPAKSGAGKAAKSARSGASKASTAKPSAPAKKPAPAAQKPAAQKPAARKAQPSRAAQASRSTNSGTKRTSAASNSSANARRRAAAKKKKNARTLKLLLAAAGVLAAIVLVVWLAGSEARSAIPSDLEGILESKKTFLSGVKLVGVDVSGMTPEEALNLVQYAAQKRIDEVAITVELEGEAWTFSGADLGMSYDLTETMADGLAYGRTDEADVQDVLASGAGEYDAVYTWNRETILLALSQLDEKIAKPATEPYAEPVTDWESTERFNYLAGEEGRALNADATADEIEAALRTGSFTATVVPVINAVLPTMTIDDVKAYTQYVAEFTTRFSAPRDDESKQNRLFNIQKAADIINGNVVQAGEQWSFNTVVGPRTYDLGWKGANGISGGKEYTTQAGGGICQVSTTLYNALLCANMEIVDRRAHSIPSDYVSKGLDATVDTNRIDFVFRNNTEHPLYIFAQVNRVEGSSSRRTMTVYIYGTPLPAGVTYQPRSEVIETTPRTDTVFSNDVSIPTGYQKETVLRHDGFVAEAYLDKYVDGVLAEGESVLLHTDKYGGNPAEIAIGTGPALLAGEAVPEGLQPVGTAPTEP